MFYQFVLDHNLIYVAGSKQCKGSKSGISPLVKSALECELACQGRSTMVGIGIPGTIGCKEGKKGVGGCDCWCYNDAKADGSCELEHRDGINVFRYKDYSE